MNIRVLALSTALLLSTGMLAQTNAPATTPDNGSSMTTTQPNNPNNGTMANNPSDNMNNTQPIGTHYRHHGGGWGWVGLFGLLGLFGLTGGRNRSDVVRSNESAAALEDAIGNEMHGSLIDVEVHDHIDQNRYGPASQHGGLKAILLDRFQCFLVQSHPKRSNDPCILRHTFDIDDHFHH